MTRPDASRARRFSGMLARIFSDAMAEDAERAELKAYLSSGAFSMAEIKEGEKEVVAGLAVQTTDPASRRGTSSTKLRSHWNRQPW